MLHCDFLCLHDCCITTGITEAFCSQREWENVIVIDVSVVDCDLVDVDCDVHVCHNDVICGDCDDKNCCFCHFHCCIVPSHDTGLTVQLLRKRFCATGAE